jgi:phosphate acyltransferase
MIVTGFKGAMTKNVFSLAGAMMVAPGMRKIKKKLDQSEYGGAPLLGLNGICIISHGASGPKAIMNAIRVAMESVENHVNERILTDLEKIGHSRPVQSPSSDSLLAGIPQG